MNINYPINLVGFDGEDDHGDVVTQEGEFLGTWQLAGTEEMEIFEFKPDGVTEPLFKDDHVGLLCKRIGEWHQGQR